MNQYSDWTLDDITLEQIKAHDFPNWVRLGKTSRAEAIEWIISYMQEREGLFISMGLRGPLVKKKKDKQRARF